MPQIDFDGANSLVKTDKIQGQSGTAVALTAGHKITGFTSTGIDDNSASATAITVNSAGEVSKPLNPTVLSQLDATQSNVTGNDNQYSITGMTWNDVLDYNADFSNGTFTAPVTGAYLINYAVHRTGLASSHTTGSTSIVGSNRTIRLGYVSAYSAGAGGASYTESGSTILDMDASDTCYIRLEDAASSQTIDVNLNTYFSATLLG